MRMKEILDHARSVMLPDCRVCKVCNGKACRGEVPGAGGVGSGNGFIRSFEYLEKIEILSDYLHEERPINTKIRLFGKEFAGPVFAAPIAGMSGNYNGYYTEAQYARCILRGCKAAGTVGFTGDGSPRDYFWGPLGELEGVEGWGVPTLKPWVGDEVFKRMELLKAVHPIAIAMDIDGACYARAAEAQNTYLEAKTPEQIREYAECAGDIPFIVKGILTAESAVKAFESGASAIVVSSHGGRVNENTPAPARMVPEIRKAVGKDAVIFVDGAIRSGGDIFKALALGADAVLVGRPYTIAAHGAGIEGVSYYTGRILRELEDTMRYAGCAKLSEIREEQLYNYR